MLKTMTKDPVPVLSFQAKIVGSLIPANRESTFGFLELDDPVIPFPPFNSDAKDSCVYPVASI